MKVGDYVYVRQDALTRPGQCGLVIEVLSDGEVAIDFLCDVHGDPKGLPTIEAWKLDELDPEP